MSRISEEFVRSPGFRLAWSIQVTHGCFILTIRKGREKRKWHRVAYCHSRSLREILKDDRVTNKEKKRINLEKETWWVFI